MLQEKCRLEQQVRSWGDTQVVSLEKTQPKDSGQFLTHRFPQDRSNNAAGRLPWKSSKGSTGKPDKLTTKLTTKAVKVELLRNAKTHGAPSRESRSPQRPPRPSSPAKFSYGSGRFEPSPQKQRPTSPTRQKSPPKRQQQSSQQDIPIRITDLNRASRANGLTLVNPRGTTVSPARQRGASGAKASGGEKALVEGSSHIVEGSSRSRPGGCVEPATSVHRWRQGQVSRTEATGSTAGSVAHFTPAPLSKTWIVETSDPSAAQDEPQMPSPSQRRLHSALSRLTTPGDPHTDSQECASCPTCGASAQHARLNVL